MSADLVMVQESVKLALDAADAAADVTAEYNKVKKENKKFLARVSSIHRMSGLIAIIAAVVTIGALALTLMIHFRSMSSLELQMGISLDIIGSWSAWAGHAFLPWDALCAETSRAVSSL